MNNFRRISITIFLVFICLYTNAQGRSSAYSDYIARYSSLAIEQMQRYGIPASITMAQGLLESGAGQSDLARKGNNHFGIKCHSWTGATIHHDDDELGECFRAYNSPRESYEDHSRFLTGSQRYRQLFSLSRYDYRAWAKGLKACGYATDPQYANRLISLIERYNLHQLDNNQLPTTAPQPATAVTQNRNVDLHPIAIYNKNYYLRARQGDTFASLAKELDISASKLARHNELSRKAVLYEGQVIWLKKKQRKAIKAFKNIPHVVSNGQSMHDIAQMYGIRLKSLYKMNDLPKDYMPRPGDRLKVR